MTVATPFFVSIEKALPIIKGRLDDLLEFARNLEIRKDLKVRIRLVDSPEITAFVRPNPTNSSFDIVISTGLIYRAAFTIAIFGAIWGMKNTKLEQMAITGHADDRLVGWDEGYDVGADAARKGRPEVALRGFLRDDYSVERQWDNLRYGMFLHDDRGSMRDTFTAENWAKLCTLFASPASETIIEVTFRSTLMLVLHEYGHVILGHFHYLKRYHKMEAFPQRGPERDAMDGYSTQSLEIDADIFAVRWINLIFGSIYGHSAERPATNFIAICNAFTLFDLNVRTLAEYKDRTHPLPEVRYLISAIKCERELVDHPTLRPGYYSQYRAGWQEGVMFCATATKHLEIKGGAFYTMPEDIIIRYDWNPKLGFSKEYWQAIDDQWPQKKHILLFSQNMNEYWTAIHASLAKTRAELIEIQREHQLRMI